MSTFYQCLKLNIVSARLYSDTQIVLGWLRTPPHLLQIIVANHINRNIDITSLQMWSHIPGDQNPADIASRGCLPTKILRQNLWWHGPTCYQILANSWPSI